MGLASAPRIFTKLTKSLFSDLRMRGQPNVIYIDEVLLLGNKRFECESNLRDTVKALNDLGFTIHPDKSVFCVSLWVPYRF